MSQNINIVELIEGNPSTKLSKTYQGKLINKLKENFSSDDQQIFVASFYCYLNYKADDFIVDLDNIWKWLGFSRKNDSKKVLEKNFKIEIDYKIVLRQVPQNLQGGRPSEKIMMNIKTFKKMCLKANTSKANEIHEYYIKLEEILHELIDEESNELRLQLEQQENRIKLLEKKNFRRQERIQRGINVVYFLTNNYLKDERIYIVGRAVKLENRLSQYDKNADHEVVYYRECHNAEQMCLIEHCLLYKLYNFRERGNRDRFILPENEEFAFFTKFLDEICSVFIDVNKDAKIVVKYTDEEYYYDNSEYNKEYKKQHYIENKDEINKKNEAWYQDNKEKVQEYNKNYREENKETLTERKKIYREEHKEEFKKRDAEYYQQNKEIINKKNKIYHEENRDKILKQRKKHYDKNIEKIRTKDRARNPKTMCECGLQICLRSLPAHRKSATHERFMRIKNNETNLELNDTQLETINEELDQEMNEKEKYDVLDTENISNEIFDSNNDDEQEEENYVLEIIKNDLDNETEYFIDDV
jgi:hypothetical protein